ncbi:type II secretion system protein [uncultured Campylobacter sp.]|uniref:type II secretion system protein n=1 Tax=uncultured Campylobacter sp. TaxID=218934 RepID=UPI00261C621A|nr:type II secretion system protein [uncultured Campylobacter sp.]
MRRGFTLIAAIFFVVIASSICMLALSIATTSVRQNSEIYLREQSELVARAATEYAVLAVLSNDFYKAGAVCIGDKNNPIKGEFGELFTFEVFVKYFGDMGVCSGDAVAVTGLNQGTVLLDVFVSSKPGKATNPINFHKRTLQKL